MKKTKIIEQIQKEFPNLSKKDINKIINIFFESIVECCKKNDSYTQNNFGKFESKNRSKRKGRNMVTGEIINISPARTIKFSISKTLFRSLNKKDD